MEHTPWLHVSMSNKIVDSRSVLVTECPVTTYTPIKDRKAHCRLIAAAPTMLEACTNALLTINDTLRHTLLSDGCKGALISCAVDLKQAIAKATGS